MNPEHHPGAQVLKKKGVQNAVFIAMLALSLLNFLALLPACSQLVSTSGKPIREEEIHPGQEEETHPGPVGYLLHYLYDYMIALYPIILADR